MTTLNSESALAEGYAPQWLATGAGPGTEQELEREAAAWKPQHPSSLRCRQAR